MGVRRQAREAALRALFMCDALDCWNVETVDLCFKHFGVSTIIADYARNLCYGAIENKQVLDAKISSASEHWSLSRMTRVDRSILRMAIFEMLYQNDVPLNVAIDEAIEVSKRYGSESSSVFINGVLDRVASDIRKGPKAIESKKTDKNANSSAEQEGEDDSEQVPLLASGTTG